ncbi:MAG: ferredoxin [Actinobacteria bacterium]|nr:ferredoxin [Actinomycetota bacterium]
MKVKVDLTLCQGYANCVDAAPEVFDLGDNGLVVLLVEEPGPEHEHAVREAARLCPVRAIEIDD